jgi:hypothetical protein
MADNKDGRTEVLGDLNFDSLEQQWRQKQMGAPGAVAPPPMQHGAAPQDSTMALDVSAADLESDMSTVSLSAAQLSNLPQFAALTSAPRAQAAPPVMPMPGAPPNMYGAPPPNMYGAPPPNMYGAPPPGMPGMPGAPTEALRLEDVEALMAKGPNAPQPTQSAGGKLVIGSNDPAVHSSPTAAMAPISAPPGQVQIKHTGSQPIYRPAPKKNTGMIIIIAATLVVLIGGGVTAVVMMGGSGDQAADSSQPTTPTDQPTTPAPEAAAKPLTYAEAWKATAALPGFNFIDLDKAVTPPSAAHLISASAQHGVRLDHADLKASLTDGAAALTKALGERAEIKAAALIYAFPFELTYQQAFPILEAGAKAGHTAHLGARSGNTVLVSPDGWDGKPAASPSVIQVKLTASQIELSGPKVDPADETKTTRTIPFADETELNEKLSKELETIANLNSSPESVQLLVNADVQMGYVANAIMALSGSEEKPLFKTVRLAAPAK